MNSTTTESGGGRPRAIEAGRKRGVAAWLDRAILFWLFAFAISAPHSIAATQTAFLCGMLFWVARFLFRPRPRLYRTPLDYALVGFFILTVISSLFSYDQQTSIGKLRAAALFMIAYLLAENVTSKRVVRLLGFTLIASCMVNVFYTLGERAAGRGVKVAGVATSSPLRAAIFVREDKTEDPTPVESGDTLLEVDGRPLRSPEELAAALDRTNDAGPDYVLLKIYRVEWTPVLKVPRARLQGQTALEKLGIANWSRGREWRAAGFYGHYTTYAEALHLIASLALGLFIALRNKLSRSGLLLAAAIIGLCAALLLTVTRASWLALLISALVITVAGANRRTSIIITACVLPLVVAGLLVLRQQRQVGFYDQQDQSIAWRETVWREGFNLLKSSPRHLLVGVGMDSIKSHWREWGLFDQGRIPVGHMHSTPLQLAVERGVPALASWLILILLYARVLWGLARKTKEVDGWAARGIVLGALGGLAGFVASGVVHYNFGDSEVVMIFYFIMGLCLAVERLAKKKAGEVYSTPPARV